MNTPSENVAERRAAVARLSLRLAAVLTVTALFAASAARAAPPTPILTGTNPPSPNIDLAPFLHGNSTGVIISSIPSSLRLGGVGVASGVEGRTISVYPNKTCEGAPTKEGSAEELDTTGIQVTVEPETTTYFSVIQSDSTGTSGCSNAISYQHVKELPVPPSEPPPPGPPSGPGPGDSNPPAPPHLRTVPAGIANDNTPLVTGTAPGAASVRIYTDPSCQGAPVASGSAARFAAGIEVQVVDNVVVAFYGVSVGPGGAASRCSAPAFYVEDSLAPHTRITMGPAAKTRRRSAIFRFTDVNGDMPGTTFFCRVDRKHWRRCSSPLRLRRLHRRGYVVRVKATDLAGNVERKPAKRRFKVISGP